MVVTAIAVAAVLAGPAAGTPAGVHATVSRLDETQRERMIGVSWHSGCPVSRADLRLLTLTYHGFDGGPHAGRLVVHRGLRVEGTSRWSNHAYGRAIDVNPIENPYVTSRGTTSHPASPPYLDRRRTRRGMATPGGTLVRAFRAVGWGWGGVWSGVRDYQHFSANGR